MERKITIGESDSGKTVKQLLYALHFSNGLIKRLKYEGSILVNGEKVTVRKVLRANDLLYLACDEPTALSPQEGDPEILYQDAFILAAAKPSGIASHPQGKKQFPNFAGQLAGYLNTGGAVHLASRLDKDTSGIILLARDAAIAGAFYRMFFRHKITKSYLAVVEGHLATHGEIDLPIAETPTHPLRTVSEQGKAAFTEYKRLRFIGEHSLVLLRPKTGRTHQLRVHMQAIGHPILGDPLYGNRDSAPRLMLHAATLCFSHPETDEPMLLYAPPPPPFPPLTKDELSLLRGKPLARHEIQVNLAAFARLERGEITVFVECFNEITAKIVPGDCIVFSHEESGATIEKEVAALYRLPDFAALTALPDACAMRIYPQEIPQATEILAIRLKTNLL